MRAVLARFLGDPRNPQLLVLASLLTYGALALDFVMTPFALPVALGTALAAEAALFRFRRDAEHPGPPYKSAVIASCSSVLLFRSTEPWAYAVVALIAIASKVAVRFRGRHFLNPTNTAALLGSLFLPGWIASGQWGHDVVLVFVLASVASVTLSRARRIDSTVAFLIGSVVCQGLRHFVLGYRWGEVAYHFSNGALWLFALAAITDPRTSPRARWARLTHGVFVAALGTLLAQLFWVRDSFMWALLAAGPLVPILDLLDTRLSSANSSSTSGGFRVSEPITVS